VQRCAIYTYACAVAYDYGSNFNVISVEARPLRPPVGCAIAVAVHVSELCNTTNNKRYRYTRSQSHLLRSKMKLKPIHTADATWRRLYRRVAVMKFVQTRGDSRQLSQLNSHRRGKVVTQWAISLFTMIMPSTNRKIRARQIYTVLQKVHFLVFTITKLDVDQF